MVNINKVGLLAKSNQPRLFRSYSDINNRTTEIYLHSIDEQKPWQNWIGTNGVVLALSWIVAKTRGRTGALF